MKNTSSDGKKEKVMLIGDSNTNEVIELPASLFDYQCLPFGYYFIKTYEK